MGTYPTSPRSAFMDWCKVHEPVFTAHAAEIGLSADIALAFKNATDESNTRSLEQESVKELSRVATEKMGTAYANLRTMAGDVVRTIRAYAETADDPAAVYAIAQVPPPSGPSPMPPPAQPRELTVTIDPTSGTMRLRWKASNPEGSTGTSYLIRRRLPGETGFTFIGVSGKKSFVDETLVAGPDSVQYTVQGQRGHLSGPVSPIFVVNFGRTPDGVTTTRVSSAAMGSGRWNVEIPAPVGHGRTVASGR